MDEEDSIENLYGNYANERSVDNLNKVVTKLKPTVDYQLASLGSSNDPVMRSKALVFTAKAVESFDPKQSSLPTYVSSQLRRLARERRALNSPIKVPERAQLDAYAISKKEQEFIDKYGREPDMSELSDFSGTSMKKLEQLQNTVMAVPTEGAMGEQQEKESPDYLREATKYVYMDGDHIDRKILELKTGHGRGDNFKLMKAKDIAAQLRISPSQISRRSLRLSKKINELKEALEST